MESHAKASQQGLILILGHGGHLPLRGEGKTDKMFCIDKRMNEQAENPKVIKKGVNCSKLA
jgi:hypothetical protein